MEMSTHRAAMCEMSVRSDRGNKQTDSRRRSPRAPRSHRSRDVEQEGKGVAANYSVRLCAVCECEGLAVDGRCQTSQPHPRYRTTCWTEAIWRVGHLSGLMLRGSDPAC